MISFVWSAEHPFWAGTGGSETYTAGHIRELRRRGIAARIITIGLGENDGRDDFSDIPFLALDTAAQLSDLDDTLVFVTYPLNVPTQRPSYAILHCPPATFRGANTRFDPAGMKGKLLLAPSKFAAKTWAKYMHKPLVRMPVVYPFAEHAFSQVERPQGVTDKPKILFAGRLSPDKGIYTLLAAMHMPGMRSLDYELTVTSAGAEAEDGPMIYRLLKAHPKITVVPSRRTPQGVAELMAAHDMVVMPSSNIFWKENFGIIAVEAQHAGCRVVASNAGGLPETDCGGLLLVRPDDPQSLANGISRAAALGSLTAAERMYASTRFTVTASVNRLLGIIRATERKQESRLLLQKQGVLVREQLDVAFKGITQLGLGVTNDKDMAYKRIRSN